jgi:hypothetical protein
VLTRALHLFLSSSPCRPIISLLRSILLLSLHLRLRLPIGLLWIPHLNFVRIPLFSHACYMPPSSHASWLSYFAIFGEGYKLRSSSCSLLQPPIISSTYTPQHLVLKHPIFILPLISETKLRTHTKLDKIIVLYILCYWIKICNWKLIRINVIQWLKVLCCMKE